MDTDNMITCVMVNDPDNSATKLTNSNLHVNRIQVNCYSSNEEALTSSSPTSSTSSSSSRLFFVNNKNLKLNQNDQFKPANLQSKQTNVSNIKLNNTISNYPNQQNINQQNNVQSIKIVQIANNSIKNDDTNKLILKTNTQLSPKSIYTEKSLKKQIYQFKERQQQQLRNYSSSSSSSSICSENKKFILNKKQNLIDKNHLSESEALSSFNYSLNSNCSTTDTLITTNDNELSEQSSDGELMRKNRSTLTPKLVNDIKVNCESNTSFLNSNSSSNLTANNQTNKPNSKFNNNCNQIDNTSTSNDTQSTDIKNNTNNCQSTPVNQNELYLFSIKRPNELKHYTHEIKFMKTPGFNILTTLIIFITILVISFLFTIGIYISVQVFDDPLTERTFEGQMISLNIGQLWNNKFIIDDLKNKFELVFNQSKFSNQFKHIEILNIKRLDELNNLKSTIQTNSTKFNKQLIEFKIVFNSNEFDLELTASNVYLIISNELIKLNESLFNNYNLDQNSLNIKEIYQDNQLNKTIENLIRLLVHNSTILNNRRLKRLQLIKLNKLNRTNQLDELDYLELLSNQTNEIKEEDEFRCENKKLSYCNFLPYNNIMYPNLVNHQNLKELENEFIYFREIIDSECFHYSAEFICLILQPPCVLDTNQILPCGQLCEQFISSCKPYIPAKLRDKFYSCQQLNKLQDSLLLFKNKTMTKDDKFSKSNKNNDDKLFKIDKRIDKKTIESTSNLIVNKKIPKLLTNEYLSVILGKSNLTTVTSLDNKEYLDYLAKEDKNLDTKLDTNSSLFDELNSELKIKLNNEFKNESNLVSSESNDSSVINNLTNLASVFNKFSSNKTITNSSSFLDNNNQQLSNCFNIDNLEQLNLSVRTLN